MYSQSFLYFDGSKDLLLKYQINHLKSICTNHNLVTV